MRKVLLKIGKHNVDTETIGAWEENDNSIIFYFKGGGNVLVPFINDIIKKKVINILEKKYNIIDIDDI